ncbi:hypothetical protein YYE_02707 [Plasmodium vinckei vinckei]|nr:hypothetical protein YYE_02707 [Plasmodium vinckei vinckei]
MTKSSYDIEKVYREFVTIGNYFGEEGKNGTTNQSANQLIHKYCHYERNSGKDKCNDYFEMASSGVIHLLKNLKEKYGLNYDKLAEYAILWLCYILNLSKKNTFRKLSDFYNSYIEKNSYYNEKITGIDNMTYKAIINKKKDLMDMNINEMFKFDAPFNTLYYLYYAIHNDSGDCTEYSSYAKMFSDDFEKLNKDSNNIENSSYNKLLSTLSNDYNNLINKYGNKCHNLKSLPELTLKKFPVENSLESSGKGSGQPTILSPEATPSSSSILNTVIPGLSTFFVIPVFLGIAYKYSLFGIDKLFQRQYLRKKLKKIKKKMEINI